MDEFTRDILKGPNYIGPAGRLRYYMKPAVPLRAMNLQSTPGTTQVCRVCRGERKIVNHHSNHLLDYERCPNCGGLGTIDPRKLEVRR